MPHKVYHGRTGVVWNVTKRALGVEVNKLVSTCVPSGCCELTLLLWFFKSPVYFGAALVIRLDLLAGHHDGVLPFNATQRKLMLSPWQECEGLQ